MTTVASPAQKWTCVHLSDIHFKRRSPSGEFAVNKDLRDHLLSDLEDLRAAGTSFNAVFVSGDIAYSGQIDEYNQAHEYLNEICNRLGIPPTEVWVVPGNHDINRKEISYSVRTWHEKVKDDEYAPRQSILDTILEDKHAQDLLLGTLENFNDFAQRYSCESKLDPVLYWQSEKHIVLNDGSSLKLRGINSAFACGHADRRGNGLFVGEQQFSNIPRENGVAWVILCHHPQDWLADGPDLMTILQNRAAVALFGHEHRPRNTMNDNLLVLNAGAVNPPESDGVQAAYNIISFWVDSQPQCRRQLVVEVQRREYRFEQLKFVPYFQENSPTLIRRISLLPFDPPEPQAVPPKATEGEGLQMDVYDEAQVKRRLIYYFFDLVEGARMAIPVTLGLITPEISKLSGRNLYLAIIDEADAKNKLPELWREVASQVQDMPKEPYPRTPPNA